MQENFYNNLAATSLRGEALPQEIARTILTSPEVDVLPLLNAAYRVRKQSVGNSVKIHIINNTQNGYCPEDCHYCAQAKTSKADIEEYPLKPDNEILAEAENAFKKGAFRYCMVFAGRGPTRKRVEHLAGLIKEIKSRYPIQICVSAGLIDDEKAKILKEAGLDRLNHNLNTSKKNYPNICTSHTFEDRLSTLTAARNAGIQLCSGMIVGLKEKEDDILEVAYTLRDMKAESIPINFLIPIKGNVLAEDPGLTPQYCLKILCLFRFLNPHSELRVAAGREIHLRQMEVMALYAANSLFLDGYLNTRGSDVARTLQMIKDAGFTIESQQNLDELIEKATTATPSAKSNSASKIIMKELGDLRPYQQSNAL